MDMLGMEDDSHSKSELLKIYVDTNCEINSTYMQLSTKYFTCVSINTCINN